MKITTSILLLFFLVLLFKGCGVPQNIEAPDNWPPIDPTPVLGDDFDEGPGYSVYRDANIFHQHEIYVTPIIYFHFDQASVRFDMQYQLDDFIKQVRSKGAYVIIEGHCDERGSIEYNQELGQRRANSVRDLMIKRGIPGYKLTAISKGELEPVDFNKTEEAYAKNRRVVFEVSQ